ncbi:MAG TPA: hypothetical protein VFV39_07550 [Limnobacter sp.]|nr:hypothetical protein [Limnobacter sp.]
MSISTTHCKETKRIKELNWNYIQVVKHLQWQGRDEDLRTTFNLHNEESRVLGGLDQAAIQELLETRATTLFSVQLDETELDLGVQERANRMQLPLGSMITHHASLLALAENPARSFLKTVLSEIQHWSAFSTNTAYRFQMGQRVVSQLGDMDTPGLIKLAQSSRSTLRPRFNTAQLSALGKTGLVPAGLLFD